MLLKRTQVGPLQFHNCLGFDSWDASGVLTSCFIYGKEWRAIRRLKALFTWKTADLDHAIIIPGLVDASGSLRYSWFVPLLLRMACELD